MKIAVIGDIHGNITALEAVYAEIQRENVDAIFCTGDLVGYLPQSNEVIAFIKEHQIISVQGNHDERFAHAKPLCTSEFEALSNKERQAKGAFLYLNQLMEPSHRMELQHLPMVYTCEVEGKTISLVHGSLTSNKEYLYHDEANLQNVAAMMSCDVLICGHTHLPYFVEVEGRYILNPGSVGKPKGSHGKSQYAILEIGETIHAKMYEVEYAIDAVEAQVRMHPDLSLEIIDVIKQET